MKKYNNNFTVYGQCTAGRIVYWQKMGVAKGIMEGIYWLMYDQKKKLSDWDEVIDVENGHSIKERQIVVVIPTSSVFKDIFEGEYPVLHYMGKPCIIDMLCLGTELQVHMMMVDYKNGKFTNGFWHSVRESLDLQDTCVLFEYVGDKLKDLIILPKEEKDKYNATGALGVGIDK